MLQISENSLILPNGRTVNFRDIIAETLLFDDVIVVRVSGDTMPRNNRNIYSVDYSGKILWQIPERKRIYEYSPFVGLSRKGELVEVFNWDGSLMTMHPVRGAVMQEGMLPISHTMHRIPHRRKYI